MTTAATAAFKPARPVPALLGVLAGAALMALSAKVSVPFWPVPLTMQGLAVLLIGAAGGRRATGSMLLYVAAGAAGLPVFASAVAGPAVLVGPTGGYLLGFVLSAAFLGRLNLLGGTLLRTGIAMLTAGGILLVSGTAWLSVLLGPQRGIELGLLPFLVPELIKVALATAIVGAASGVLRRRQ